jgi:D-sedoheptulose 7-phosphate isomerase
LQFFSTMACMADPITAYFDEHISLARRMAAELGPKIEAVGQLLCDSFGKGGKLLTLGNGGSACDSQHLAEELIGRFKRTRRPLPAIALSVDGAAMTCIANDFSFQEVFSRQVTALAEPGDVVVGISTSGNSENVVRALAAAKTKRATTVALLGNTGGKIAPEVDHALIVPSNITSHIQEMHICIVHLLCDRVDRWAAGERV